LGIIQFFREKPLNSASLAILFLILGKKQMTDLLQKLAPHKLDKVMRAYVKIWASNNQNEYQATPLISVYLSNGQVVSGEIIHIDLEDRMLSLRLLPEAQNLDVMFLSFDLIQTWVLHNLQQCPGFVDELAKLG
jgi:hypothetical protein